jgi:hypothetical protein
MTVYTTEDVTSGRIPPCRIFDADGQEIFYVIRCNIETGEVTRLASEDNGQTVKLNAELNAFELIEEVRPAPLKMIKINE